MIDAHSRRVIGWAIAAHMRTDLIEDALMMAMTLRGDRPAHVIFHSDRDTQYASAQVTAFAIKNGITRSMGLTGICWDNAMAESFFATLKTEFYYRRVWPTRDRATREVGAWIEDRYNHRRRHSSIGQVSPVDFELQYSSKTAEVQLAAQPVSTNRGHGHLYGWRASPRPTAHLHVPDGSPACDEGRLTLCAAHLKTDSPRMCPVRPYRRLRLHQLRYRSAMVCA